MELHSHSNIFITLLPERKNSRLNLLLENTYSFWDYRIIIHQEQMVKGIKTNSKIYIKTLKWLKEPIKCVCQGEKADASSI
jgi:hypothetical protein